MQRNLVSTGQIHPKLSQTYRPKESEGTSYCRNGLGPERQEQPLPWHKGFVTAIYSMKRTTRGGCQTSSSPKRIKDQSSAFRKTYSSSLCKVHLQRCSLQPYQQDLHTLWRRTKLRFSLIEDPQHGTGVQIQCRIGQEIEVLVTACTSSHLGGEPVAPALYFCTQGAAGSFSHRSLRGG
ncbi:hypothetical protein HPB51_009008 [Rhipicephalus microplus]|uniref:Uncharacterized protein n=1 Tax=Rhipicephalus microplus TaxID=6941 RepID=A0A9J6D4P9_RHIMP|nr:hypothetical protein HPB51_009008 [Rhipicephalus microplus]